MHSISSATHPASGPRRLLVVDAEEKALRPLAELLHRAGYEVQSFLEVESAQRGLEQTLFDLALIDANLPEHLMLRQALQETHPDCPILWLTPTLTTESTAHRLGVEIGYVLGKPVRSETLYQAINLALANARLIRSLRRETRDLAPLHGLIGSSAPWRKKIDEALWLASGNMTIVLLGETGTGKSVLAEAIHRASPRAGYLFVTADLTATPESLQMDELFGHVRGAYTSADKARTGLFQLANHGTLFLDEVGDLKPDVQAALLRVLEKQIIKPVGSNAEVEVDVRVLAATNKNLPAEIQANRFRFDLYHRLFQAQLELPPLRQRREDILPLAQHFAQPAAQQRKLPDVVFSLETIDWLQHHPWPGNIRELRSTVEVGVQLLRPGEPLQPVHFRLSPAMTEGASLSVSASLAPDLFQKDLATFLNLCEQEYLSRLLTQFAGDKNKAAHHADIQVRTLNHKMGRHGIREE